jgi:hypothetical protein
MASALLNEVFSHLGCVMTLSLSRLYGIAWWDDRCIEGGNVLIEGLRKIVRPPSE